MKKYSVMDEDWKTLMSFFPSGWREECSKCGAMSRQRGFGSEESLIRALLLHVGRGYSLRETAVRTRASGIAEISDVALLKRLRKSEGWLRTLCRELFQEMGLSVPAGPDGKNMRVIDATHVKEPGKTGSVWRLHYSVQLPTLMCDYFRVSGCKGKGTAESFLQIPVKEGDCVMGDRIYCTSQGIEYLVRSGADVVVRVNTGALPLYTKSGRVFPLRQKLSGLTTAGKIRQWRVWVQGEGGLIAGRVCVLRKSQLAIEQAYRKMKRKASRSKVKTRPETLEFAKYVIVFTTFSEDQLTATQVLEWYRSRWQIELVFKRLKSLAQLGHLPKYDEQSSRAWLYGKLFVALLTQKLIRVGREISPWGYQLDLQTSA